MTNITFTGADVAVLHSLLEDIKNAAETWAARSSNGPAVWGVAFIIFREMDYWTRTETSGALHIEKGKLAEALSDIVSHATDLDVTEACDKLRAKVGIRT